MFSLLARAFLVLAFRGTYPDSESEDNDTPVFQQIAGYDAA